MPQTTFYSARRAFLIAIKAAPSRAEFRVRPEAVAEEARDIEFIELAAHASVASRVADLSLLHRAPFDRLLVAQAIAEPAVLYTTDARLPPIPNSSGGSGHLSRRCARRHSPR